MIPKRCDIALADTWDLSALYTDQQAWEQDLTRLRAAEAAITAFRGTLAQSAQRLSAYCHHAVEVEKLEERLGYYAMLRQSEDAGLTENQDRYARFMQVSAVVTAADSFARAEIQAIPETAMQAMLQSGHLNGFERVLERIIRFRPHTLPAEQERLLALQQESQQTPNKAFAALLDVDLDFGTVDTPEGPRALSQSTFGSLIEHRDRSVRRNTFEQFYRHFDGHKNTLSALLTGSVHQDIYRAKVRSYSNALEMSLFPDNVPLSVYDTLVSTVREHIGVLHRYYALRARVLRLTDFALWDTKVPLVADIAVRTPFSHAIDVVLRAMEPLGPEYVAALESGLRGRWVDKYENQGKRSGAFSAGSYQGDPYILMNYKEDSFRDVFTLAHEAGHSMHSWYSVRTQPFQDYHYTIFEAEVASTFNEQLLAHHLLQEHSSGPMRAYVINKQLDDMIGTLFRQTMFAEYERIIHAHVENNGALTTEFLRTSYRRLLEYYFGDGVQLSAEADLEGLRIPHFYRAFYVYKYATGISAAVALAQQVLEGGDPARERYLQFLRSGGSRFPIDSLATAGVDMREPTPIVGAIRLFTTRLEQLEELLPTAHE